MSTDPIGSAGGAAQQAAGQAQHAASQAAGQVHEQAQQVAGQAKSRLREQVDQRSSQAAEQLSQQASDLRAVSSSLREQGKSGPASAADRIAEYAERVGGYLEGRDSEALLHDIEDLGRRQPWAVAAGGLAAGFALSRFLKASSSRRYSDRQSGAGAAFPGAPASRAPVPGAPASRAPVPGALREPAFTPPGPGPYVTGAPSPYVPGESPTAEVPPGGSAAIVSSPRTPAV